ncbi:MAG: hypothetical protein HYX75_07455 [Acidobacteria bacterium]|nr:hypothetical protein [Acidobacteriota bacterium]
MRKILSALTVGAVLLISAAASETAEKYYIPVIMEDTTGTLDLYWMKLRSNGTIAKGPVLVRDSATSITSATIVPEGNKMLYTEYDMEGANQIYSVGVNPKNGTLVNGPTQLTTGSSLFYWPSIAKDGRKFSYSQMIGGFDSDVFLKKFKPNGSLGPATISVAATGAWELYPMITDDGQGVYYVFDDGGSSTAIVFQKLKPRGKPSGTPIMAVTYPGENVYAPRVDAKREWMSYSRGYDIWVTRLAASGAATGTPVKVTSVAAGYFAWGGLTRHARLLVYTVMGGAPYTRTLYSQRLDKNGNPTGAPVILVPMSPNKVFPWYEE